MNLHTVALHTVESVFWQSGPLFALGSAPQGTASPWTGLLPLIAIVAVFYFVLLLPMKKKQQKIEAFLGALKVGDKVVTSGGLFGSVTRLSDQSVQLQIANNVRVEVSRAAIVGYQGQEPVAPESTQS